MSCKIVFEKKIPELKAKTEIFSTVKVWDNNNDMEAGAGTDPGLPTWTYDYGELLLKYAEDYLSHINATVGFAVPMSEFEELDDWERMTAYDTFEIALQSRSWETTHWKDSLLTRVEQAGLSSFQNAGYVAHDSSGHLVFIKDRLSLVAWYDEHVDADDFVEWVNDFRRGEVAK